MTYVMRPAASLGLVLVVFGLIVLGFGSITYSRADAVVDVQRVDGEAPGTVPLPPEFGILVMAGGAGLVVKTVRRQLNTAA